MGFMLSLRIYAMVHSFSFIANHKALSVVIYLLIIHEHTYRYSSIDHKCCFIGRGDGYVCSVVSYSALEHQLS